MSTKCTIFLTEDYDEHFYEDVSCKQFKNDGFIGNSLILEIDMKNINILSSDSDSLVIEFKNPESEIYKLLKAIKQ